MELNQRIFLPGSRWVYFKIYTGYKTADQLLINEIATIIHLLKQHGLLEKWFFVRYFDTDFHLRVRILVKNEIYVGRVLSIVHETLADLVEEGFIWNIQLDTYKRELERYGNDLIQESESIFYMDSEYTLRTIQQLNNYLSEENYRWQISLKLIDSFLSGFQLDIYTRQILMEDLSASFKKEYSFDMYNSKQFNSKFRENKKDIEAILNDEIENPVIVNVNKLIESKNQVLSIIIKKITEECPKGFFLSLLSSYIHMAINRLFRSKHRLHELIIYDFMYRYYTSEIARNKSIIAK